MQRILFDNVSNVEVYAVQTAHNGEEGLNLIRHAVLNRMDHRRRGCPELEADELVEGNGPFGYPNIPIIVEARAAS